MKKAAFILSGLLSIASLAGFAAEANAGTTITVNVGGKVRDLVLQYPTSTITTGTTAKLAPLVMIFHGGGGNAEFFEGQNSELSDLLLKSGYAVAFMDGTGPLDSTKHTWNADHCCSYAFENKIDEAAYIKASVSTISSRYSIDRSKVFLVGYSNGGMLDYRVTDKLFSDPAAASNSSINIKGVAIISSAIFKDQPALKNPFSLLMVHSKDDPVIPYTGGISDTGLGKQDMPYESFASATNFFRSSLGCTSVSNQTYTYGVVQEMKGCKNNKFIRAIHLLKGGHSWDKSKDTGLSTAQTIYKFIEEAKSR